MKHLNNLACVLAMLAAGSGFTACSSDDVVDGGNTNNGVAGKMVKTSFALNIPYGGKSGRMSVKETQAETNATSGNFNGMYDMRLLSFNGDVASANLKKKICLGGTEDAFQKVDRRSVYRDVTIPVGTTNFLFYGETYDHTDFTMDQMFEKGYLEASNALKSAPAASDAAENSDVTLENIKFGLKTILGTGTTFADDAKAQVIIAALKDVYTTSYNSKTWSEIATVPSNATEKHAAEMFSQFRTLKAGSAAAVKLTLEQLKKSCGREVPTSLDNANDILEAIAYNANAAIASIDYKGDETDFPRNLGMPDGAAKGSFSDAGEFTYDTKNTTITSSGIDYTKIAYPAALNYFIQTGLGANDNAFNTLSNWPSINDWLVSYNWVANGWGDKVVETTRTIALKTPIQYGVANLQSNVTVTASTLEDNAHNQGKLLENQKITTSAAKNFKLTGVLVGAQPASVNWDYTPTAPITDAFDYTIYDRKMTTADNAIFDGGSTTNYTLVLDNANATAKSLYVTLELVNNTGVDFYGADGLVPNSGRFYLVGTLDPTVSSTITADNNQDHVFVKSHRTIANFKIGANSLKNAYNTIPDLRSTQISLGLAVDLQWKSGIEFSVDL